MHGAGRTIYGHDDVIADLAMAYSPEQYELNIANAARIVAAVNGCAGLNPAAYQSVMEALRECITHLQEACPDRYNAGETRTLLINAGAALALAASQEQPA